MFQPEIKVFPDVQSIAAESAERVVRAASEALALSGRFSLGLAGGSTPKALYQLLAADPFRSQVDWPKVQIFFGDERCVPSDHADSNFRMASEALLSKVPIPPQNIHRMRGEAKVDVHICADAELTSVIADREP